MTFALILVADAVRKFRRLIFLKGARLLHCPRKVRRPALHRPVLARAHPSAYEDWTRGRIVFDQSKDRFVLYADRKLMLPATTARIQKQFSISAEQTTVETDLHYQSSEMPGPLS